jgi:hypothetical protein
MKVSRNPMFSFMTAAIVLGASSFAAAQATAPASQQPPSKPPAQSQSAMQTMTMQGELVSVDTDEKTFIVMGSASSGSSSSAPAPGAPAAGAPAARSSAANQNVEFKYDDDTQVTGSQTRIEGLATAKASRVTVHYTDDAGEKLATRIEVQAASAMPSSSTPGSSARPPASTTPNPPAAPGTPQQPGAPR